jgi:hypothetical protein
VTLIPILVFHLTLILTLTLTLTLTQTLTLILTLTLTLSLILTLTLTLAYRLDRHQAGRSCLLCALLYPLHIQHPERGSVRVCSLHYDRALHGRYD